jgi:hypothetical protein
MNASDLATMIRPGQFVVGHLPYNEDVKSGFSDFRKIFLYRNLRDSIVSYMRFTAKKNIPGYEKWSSLPNTPNKLLEFLKMGAQDFFKIASPMVEWLNDDEVLSICFEELLGDNGKEKQQIVIKKIIEFIGVSNIDENLYERLLNVFGSDTVTWSGKRSNWQEYWNEDVEDSFVKMEGESINCVLGYRP